MADSIGRYREQNQNQRTQFGRILRRAGVQQWPKLFVNLRSNRETELNNEFPQHMGCKWLDNSPTVAMKHYLQITDAHFGAAVGHADSRPDEKFAQKVAQQFEESGCHAVPPQYGDTEKQNTDENYAQYRYPQGRLNHHFYADFKIGSIAIFLNHPLIFSNKQKLDSPTEAFAPILLQTKTLIFSFSDHSTLQAKIRDPETCLA